MTYVLEATCRFVVFEILAAPNPSTSGSITPGTAEFPAIKDLISARSAVYLISGTVKSN